MIQYKSSVRDLALIDRQYCFRFLSDHCETRKMSIGVARVADEILRKNVSGRDPIDSDVPWLVKIGGMCSGIIFQFPGSEIPGSEKRK